MLSMRKGNPKRYAQEQDKMPILRLQDAVQAKNQDCRSQGQMMDYKNRLTIKKDTDRLYRYIMPEIKDMSRKRCTVELKKTNDRLDFEIIARDITSLKASLNSIVNSIDLFEKTKDLVEDEQGD